MVLCFLMSDDVHGHPALAPGNFPGNFAVTRLSPKKLPDMLSNTAILKAKPKATPYKLPLELGLFVLVNPNGSKWWRFAYTFVAAKRCCPSAHTLTCR